jgi:hypothetical protein
MTEPTEPRREATYEREVQHDPQVLEGDDEIPRQPIDRDAAPDAYEPEAVPTAKARLALWAALAVLLIVTAFIVWAIVD